MQAKVSLIPSASALVMKALKEPVRDRKKVRTILSTPGRGAARLRRYILSLPHILVARQYLHFLEFDT